MIVYVFSLKFDSTPNNSIESLWQVGRLLIQGSRPFPTPGSSWTSERTSMFEVDIETFERCNARPERNKAKGKWPLVDWLNWDFFKMDIQVFLWLQLVWFVGYGQSKQKNQGPQANEFSWLHCTYQFLMASLRHSEWDTGLSDLMEQHNWQLKAYSPVPGLFFSYMRSMFVIDQSISKLWILFRSLLL